MRKIKIILVMLLLAAGCYKKNREIPVLNQKKVEVKEVENLCETGTIDDLFTKNCTKEQKLNFIERMYGDLDCDVDNRLDCNEIYQYIAYYDDLDLYKALVRNQKKSILYFEYRPDFFIERCHNRKSDAVGLYFFKKYAKEIVFKNQMDKRIVDIYNYYFDLGVSIDSKHIKKGEDFYSSLTYYIFSRTNIEEGIEEDYRNLVRKIIKSSEYFIPKNQGENKLNDKEIKKLISRLCGQGAFISLIELLNVVGPVVSIDIFREPNDYFGCFKDPRALEALLTGFDKDEVRRMALQNPKLLSAFLRSLDSHNLKTKKELYLIQQLLDLFLSYIKLSDLFTNLDSEREKDFYRQPILEVNLKLLKLFLPKISTDQETLKHFGELYKVFYARNKKFKVNLNDSRIENRLNAILKFIQDPEEAFIFIEENLSDDKEPINYWGF